MMLLPWDLSVRHELPVGTWREMISRHYPEGDWVRLSAGTLERLRRPQGESGLGDVRRDASPAARRTARGDGDA